MPKGPPLVVYPVRLSPIVIRKLRRLSERDRLDKPPTVIARELIDSALAAKTGLFALLTEWRSTATELEQAGQQIEADRIWACCESLRLALNKLGLGE